jgi:hypothetical protein
MSAMEGAASEAEAEEEAEEEEEEEEVVAVAEGAAPAPLEEECLRFMVEGVYVGLRRGGVADDAGRVKGLSMARAVLDVWTYRWIVLMRMCT